MNQSPGPRLKQIALHRLTLSAFRNYVTARCQPDGAPFVVLTGENGAGKTNLLEAVSLLTSGRGLRGVRLSDLQSHKTADPWAVAAEGVGLFGAVKLGTGRDPSSEAERRTIRIDGDSAGSQTALAAHLPMLWLTPQMDGLFIDSASARRRFLDRMVFAFDPAHSGRVSRYERVMRDRAALLRDGGADKAWLGALEARMAETAVSIAAARLHVIDRLNAAGSHAISAFPRPELAISGDIEQGLSQKPALKVEEDMQARLAANRSRDAETGGAALGPHRSDFLVHMAKTGMSAAQCSTGEQKALLISIILSQARLVALERGGSPMLLLDEVAAHLDEARRYSLYDELAAMDGQCWLTGTDFRIFEPLSSRAAFVRVADGNLAAK